MLREGDEEKARGITAVAGTRGAGDVLVGVHAQLQTGVLQHADGAGGSRGVGHGGHLDIGSMAQGDSGRAMFLLI